MWEGYVIRVNLNDIDSLNFVYHSASIMVKMIPDDQEGGQGADLGISLSERVYTIYKDELETLRRGDHIQFNATLMSMGDLQHLHHLHAFQFEKVPGKLDVDVHYHNTGRY